MRFRPPLRASSTLACVRLRASACRRSYVYSGPNDDACMHAYRHAYRQTMRAHRPMRVRTSGYGPCMRLRLRLIADISICVRRTSARVYSGSHTQLCTRPCTHPCTHPCASVGSPRGNLRSHVAEKNPHTCVHKCISACMHACEICNVQCATFNVQFAYGNVRELRLHLYAYLDVRVCVCVCVCVWSRICLQYEAAYGEAHIAADADAQMRRCVYAYMRCACSRAYAGYAFCMHAKVDGSACLPNACMHAYA